jgi:hypothetical protein
MQTIAKFTLAALIGVLLYLTVFVFVVHKPLTVGIKTDYFDYKVTYISSIASQHKIAIFAGSNGRFSHRCETIEQLTNIKCANLSIGAGSNLKWEFARYKPYFKQGDVLYLPLEYRQPFDASSEVGDEAPYVVAYDHLALFDIYSLNQLGHALFYFDIKYGFSGFGEMLMSDFAKKRRFYANTMTKQGDETGHNEVEGVAYRQLIDKLPITVVNKAAYESDSYWNDVKDILDWGKLSDVIIIGGLPVTFDDSKLPEEVIDFLRNFYRQHGHCFLVLPNKSLYPRSFFYDTAYHLNEASQIQHSRIIAPYLAQALTSHTCPAAE